MYAGLFNAHKELTITGEPMQLLDGGSIYVPTNKGKYFIDKRLGTETKGKVFRGSPKKDYRNLVDDQAAIKNDLILAFQNSKKWQSWERIISASLVDN